MKAWPFTQKMVGAWQNEVDYDPRAAAVVSRRVHGGVHGAKASRHGAWRWAEFRFGVIGHLFSRRRNAAHLAARYKP
jgi:hypothetical protein